MSLVLYDFARRVQPNRGWAYNVWKIRLVLNYKGIPFETSWMNHLTLEPTMESLGVPAYITREGFRYTLPTMKFPDDSVITDSAVIAEKLETLYPSPSLHLDPDLEAEVGRILDMTIAPLLPIYFQRVARDIIEESTVSNFATPRERVFGMSLDELEKTKGGPQAWEAAEPGLHAMKLLLIDRKRDEGPFIHGSQVCYADFNLVAFFQTCERGGEDLFEGVVKWDPRFEDLYNASKAWLENDQ